MMFLSITAVFVYAGITLLITAVIKDVPKYVKAFSAVLFITSWGAVCLLIVEGQYMKIREYLKRRAYGKCIGH